MSQYKNEKVEKDVWLFTSYSTRYSDSPKVVSEYIHEKYPEIKIYWILETKYFDFVPDYINKIDSKNKKEVENIKMHAEVVIDNIMGPQAKILFSKKIKNIISFKFRKFFDKRKYQYVFSFWHGTPSKKSFNESKELKTTDMSLGRTYFLLGSNYAINRFKIRTKNKAMNYVLTGTPRNDLILKERNTDLLKDFLGLPKDKKIILYAPTFRADATSTVFNLENSGINQLEILDINKVLEKFANAFSNDFVLVTKFHHLVQDKINLASLKDKYKNKIYFGDCYQDINDYISCSDVLITDYSSIMFDYLLTKKPIFIFAHDYEQYAKDRGTLIDVRELGFPFATKDIDFYNCIENFDYNTYLTNVNILIDKFGFYTFPNATENAVQYIMKTIRRK